MMTTNRTPCPPPSEGGLLSQLYGGKLSFLLPLVSAKWLSDLGGKIVSSRPSKLFIKNFIKKNGIDMSEYPKTEYDSFNSFFTREIIPEKRPGRLSSDPQVLISPADSRLTVYEVSDGLTFRIKGGDYSLASLLGSESLARSFGGGYVMVFRLSVDDYHRYCFFDGGSLGYTRHIEGKYYTVQQLALNAVDFYKENTREVSILDTDNFGRAAYVEVGATFVGRISNRKGISRFECGEEKGMFEFGGSTVVVVLEKGRAVIDEDILRNSSLGFETRVKIGERVGKKP